MTQIAGPTILLHSGAYFNLLQPERSVTHIEDIAHALANICRFCGHTDRFYSVAEHCVHASRHVLPAFAKEALLHDATEAYVGDMSKPLKKVLPSYEDIEDRIDAVIRRRYDLPATMTPEVHHVDLVMLVTEQFQVMRNRDEWVYALGKKPLDITLPCWNPEQARAEFLARYYELYGV